MKKQLRGSKAASAATGSPPTSEKTGRTAGTQTWNFTNSKPPPPPSLRKGLLAQKRQDSGDKDKPVTEDPVRISIARSRTEPLPHEISLAHFHGSFGTGEFGTVGMPGYAVPSNRFLFPPATAPFRRPGELDSELSPCSNSSCDTHTWPELPSPVTPLCQSGPAMAHMPPLGSSAGLLCAARPSLTSTANPPLASYDRMVFGAGVDGQLSAEGALFRSFGRSGSSPADFMGRGAGELLSCEEKRDARGVRMSFPKGLRLGPGGLSLVDSSCEEEGGRGLERWDGSSVDVEARRWERQAGLPWVNRSDFDGRLVQQNLPGQLPHPGPIYRQLSLDLSETQPPEEEDPTADARQVDASCDWQANPLPLPSPLGTGLHGPSPFSMQDEIMTEQGRGWDSSGGGGGGEGGGGEGPWEGLRLDVSASPEKNLSVLVSEENKRGAPDEWEELLALVEEERKRAKMVGGEKREEEKSSLEKALVGLRGALPGCEQVGGGGRGGLEEGRGG